MKINYIGNTNIDQEVNQPRNLRIGKTIYIVNSIFKENTDVTIVSKISRLIKTEASKTLLK